MKRSGMKGVALDRVVRRVLELAAENDCHHSIFWHRDLEMFAMCNDLFWWATADAEAITADTLPILEQAFIDADYMGTELYCCRVRKMRPQGAYYRDIHQDLWPIFDACGPMREVDSGNPFGRPN